MQLVYKVRGQTHLTRHDFGIRRVSLAEAKRFAEAKLAEGGLNYVSVHVVDDDTGELRGYHVKYKGDPFGWDSIGTE